MFVMNATFKPRAMAAYTASSSNMSRERVLRVFSIGRSSDDPSSRRCERRCRTSIDCFTNEEQEPERGGLRVHGSRTVSKRSGYGTGLPAQINGTQFTPFVTTKAHGVGIGLTITQTIVETHGGTIDARNNPEGGATFTVTLRRSELPGSRCGPSRVA